MYLYLLSNLVFAENTTFANITTALSYNRIGLASIGQYGLHIPMWEQEGKALFQNTGIDIVGELNATPAFIRPGIRLTIAPLAILNVQLYAQGTEYFGNFQTIVTYDDLSVNYGSNADIRTYASDTNRQYNGYAWDAGGKLTLQAKVQQVVFLNNTDLGYWNIPIPEEANGVGMFERERELMLEIGGDTVFENNTMLLYQIDLAIHSCVSEISQPIATAEMQMTHCCEVVYSS